MEAIILAGGLLLAWCKRRLVRGTNNASIASWRLQAGLPVTSVPRKRWIHRLARRVRWSRPIARLERFKRETLPWVLLVVVAVLLLGGIWRWISPGMYHWSTRTVTTAVQDRLSALAGLEALEFDLVDTGNTLRANGLKPMEHIADISSRLIVNKAAMKMKHGPVTSFVEEMEAAVAARQD